MSLSRASIHSVVERQMRNWELARQQEPPGEPAKEEQVKPFVAFSRSAGSAGGEVAAMVAQETGWPLFDRAILQFMADDDAVRTRLYRSLDERDTSYLQESLRVFFGGDLDRNDYFHRLTATVLALARKGNAIFVGRGADLILPRELGLRVRLIDLPGPCAKRYAEEHGIDPVRASRDLNRLTQERNQFVRHHFKVDPNAADRFDLTLNLSALSVVEAAEVVLGLLRRRGEMG